MTRTTVYKATYYIYFLVGGAGALWFLDRFRWSPWSIAVVLVVGLLPGRVLGFFWRDLLRGLRLLRAGECRESRKHSERFLIQLHKRPWIRHLIWLGSASYSRDPEALAFNNLGAAELRLGELTAAEAYLRRAIVIDRQFPLPYFNLGNLFLAKELPDEALRCFSEAKRLGFDRRNLTDKIAMAAQARFALTDGFGRSS